MCPTEDKPRCARIAASVGAGAPVERRSYCAAAAAAIEPPVSKESSAAGAVQRRHWTSLRSRSKEPAPAAPPSAAPPPRDEAEEEIDEALPPRLPGVCAAPDEEWAEPSEWKAAHNLLGAVFAAWAAECASARAVAFSALGLAGSDWLPLSASRCRTARRPRLRRATGAALGPKKGRPPDEGEEAEEAGQVALAAVDAAGDATPEGAECAGQGHEQPEEGPDEDAAAATEGVAEASGAPQADREAIDVLATGIPSTLVMELADVDVCGGDCSSTTATARNSEHGGDAVGPQPSSPVVAPSAPPVNPTMWFGLDVGPRTAESRNLIEEDVIAAFSASSEVHGRLADAADAAAQALMTLGMPLPHVVLYGSLSMGRSKLQGGAAASGPACFITNLSDIDFAILCEAEAKDGTAASSMVDRFCRVPTGIEWHQVHATLVPRFAVTQWTLVSNSDVHLDLTVFSDAAKFLQFKERQRAFREIFWQTRQQLCAAFGPKAEMAFDAYIYLLKAFAIFLGRSALTSFQATSLGLFVVQRAWLAKGSSASTPTALGFFRRFLFFCEHFFADGPPPKTKGKIRPLWHRSCALGFADYAQVIERVSPHARCELYFVAAETNLEMPTSGWMNVLHSVDPEAVKAGAQNAMDRWFSANHARTVWNRLSNDLVQAMKSRPSEPCLGH